MAWSSVGNRLLAALLLAAAFIGTAFIRTAPAIAADPVHVGRSATTSLAFTPMEIGIAKGYWARQGLDITLNDLRGDAAVQQAMTSGDIDIGLGSGPALGLLAKGVPARAVAAISDAPADMMLFVTNISGIHDIAGLRGQHIAVTTLGSLTDWLVRQISVRRGWPQDAVTSVALGDVRSITGAAMAGQIPGFVFGLEIGYRLEQEGKGRVLLDFARIVPHFHTHLVFARNAFLQENPALVKRFLDGWFETVRDMRAHPDETIALAAKFEDMPPEVMRRVYPAVMPQMSVTGRFEPAAIDAIRKSLLDTGMVSTDTDLNNMIDTRFVGGAR